jgi:putative endopeptidase
MKLVIFDDQGSTSDGDGVRNWWTPKDLTAFKQKQEH